MVTVRSSREVSDCRPRENQIVFHGKNRKRHLKNYTTPTLCFRCAQKRARWRILAGERWERSNVRTVGGKSSARSVTLALTARENTTARTAPLPPRQAETWLRGLQPLPSRKYGKQLLEVHRLPPRQARDQLRGIQNGTRGSAELEANQARAGDQTRIQDQARNKRRVRSVHHPRLFRHRRVKKNCKKRIGVKRVWNTQLFRPLLQNRHRVFQEYLPRDPQFPQHSKRDVPDVPHDSVPSFNEPYYSRR